MAMAEEAERGPRIVKYLRLESYEDALNNIAFDDPSGQQAMQFNDYLLQYMLQWETRKSETLLNVEKLARPFHYKLRIHADGQTREKPVDISETFNHYHRLIACGEKVKIPPADLARYDDDIRAHLQVMNARRPEPITLRYFQYLAALYTEVFLDRYFHGRAQILRVLNAFVEKRNAQRLAGETRDADFAAPERYSAVLHSSR